MLNYIIYFVNISLKTFPQPFRNIVFFLAIFPEPAGVPVRAKTHTLAICPTTSKLAVNTLQ